MRKYIIILIALFITACGGGQTYPMGTPTATPNPGEIALQMMQQQMAANATEQVIGLNFSATAQIIGVTSTVQAAQTQEAIDQRARMDAQATADQHRADAQATQNRMDMDAQATQQRIDADATQAQARRDAQATSDQARLDMVGTQSANATATFAVMTLTAIPPHATLTQMAVNNQIVLSTQDVERSALSLKQARDTNVISWLIPIILAVFLMLVGALYLYNQSQVREIHDADGNTDVIIFKNRMATKPSQWAGPLLDLTTYTMPQLSAPAEQAEVTKRAQGIAALAVMPVQPTASGAAFFNDVFSTPQKREESFEIIENDEVPVNLLDGETLKVLDKDWKDANEQ
jgi:hypothetical protein